ncbi:Sulfate permease 2 [Rhodosporidiobolus nylandii]
MSLSARQRLARWIGHDPVVTSAASTTATLKQLTHGSGGAAKRYVLSLFPFLNWIANYNLQWAAGDLIAGLTVGMVVVPQSMSYAKIATLAPEFGLYSSFVGVMIYALFATSKDVTIGPVAVMSLQVSKVIDHVHSQPGGADIPGYIIGTVLALMCGLIVLGIGLLRLGWIVEFISAPAVAGFMTGSAISICAGQVPGLLGTSKLFDTRAATYEVIINTLKHLPDCTRDAAFGLFGLAFLIATKYIFGAIERKAKSPVVRRAAFFAGTLRTGFFIIFATLFSWVYCRNYDSKHYPISILKTVPSGFKHMGVPKDFNSSVIGPLGSQIPVSTIILLLEHIAISKSFGRVNNYKINPNQELIAIGVNNIFSSFFGAYPSTGSFSRSAIKSKAGVRTPLAGWVTGVVVVVALYALTGAFYWIPNAGLSAIIIDAVMGLIAHPRQTYGFFQIAPLEGCIFLIAVILTVFTTIEIGIYFSIAASAALLLVRIAKPRGKFLGRVRVRQDDSPSATALRDVYLPINPDGVRNSDIQVEAPPPGVIVFRMEEAFLYVNASHYADQISDYAKAHTKNGQDYSQTSQGDRPWNDPGPNRFQKSGKFAQREAERARENKLRPTLKAVVFDFSGVSNVDSTSVQNLVDLRRVLTRWAGDEVTFHFATILSPWIKRALLAGGFGRDPAVAPAPVEVATVVPQEENADTASNVRPAAPPLNTQTSAADIKEMQELDIETGLGRSSSIDKVPYAEEPGRASYAGSIVDSAFTCFHLDLPSAVAAAAGTAKW